jgi:hypothetical protein
VLLPQKPDAVNHLLSSGPRCIESSGETGILFLEKLNPLRRDNALHARGLEALDPRFGLKRTTTE